MLKSWTATVENYLKLGTDALNQIYSENKALRDVLMDLSPYVKGARVAVHPAEKVTYGIIHVYPGLTLGE